MMSLPSVSMLLCNGNDVVPTAYLETFFPIFILLKEIGSIDEDLSVGDLQTKDLIVDSFGRIDGSD